MGLGIDCKDLRGRMHVFFQNNLGARLLVAQMPHLLPLCSILAEHDFFTRSEKCV